MDGLLSRRGPDAASTSRISQEGETEYRPRVVPFRVSALPSNVSFAT
jgi:hypothetical protein